ncbi:bestrophin family protein [Kiloniella majae]|uniref:bestrophin family protein n=1 Tax=Kiloniella majae TaxID=1938558 RepID=UPI000A2777BB|nr:bestrophin family ion channel [Kiloniella majae]
MIIRDKPSAFRLFFVLKGSVVPTIAPQILFSAMVGFFVYFAYSRFPNFLPILTVTPFILLGVTLSIFLGFRNRASYERWWEARKLWGQLIIDTRSLARQVQTYAWAENTSKNNFQPEIRDKTTDQVLECKTHQKHLVQLAISFSHALRHHLRGTDYNDDVYKFLSPDTTDRLKKVRHKPNFILNLMGEELRQLLQKEFIGEISARNLEERLTSLSAILAACERIHNTPLPFAYNLLLHRTAYIYCFCLPFGLVTSLGLMTPFVTAIIAYTFFGLDALGEELEDPFGTSAHDLALTTMSHNIEINLLETLNEDNLPEPVEPDGYYHV